MVDKKELRVGNYIKTNGIYRAKVMEIGSSTLTIEYFNIEERIIKVINIEDAYYVDLDETQLISFDFQITYSIAKNEYKYSDREIKLNGASLHGSGGTFFEKGIGKYETVNILWCNGDYHYILYTFENDNVYNEYSDIITKKIYYVHELQNFHFAFTRKELD